jgi:hypothetical protein
MKREPLTGHRGSGLETEADVGSTTSPTIMSCRLASVPFYLRMTCYFYQYALPTHDPHAPTAPVRPAPRRSVCGDIAAQDRSAWSRGAGHSVEYSVDGSASWQSDSPSSSLPPRWTDAIGLVSAAKKKPRPGCRGWRGFVTGGSPVGLAWAERRCQSDTPKRKTMCAPLPEMVNARILNRCCPSATPETISTEIH